MEKKSPKYIELAKWIKEKISKDGLEKGDKFYTENDLADMFSVSRQTVRQAKEVLIKEGILESQQGSGTYISTPKYTKKNASKTIGVIVTYFDEYIFPSIINGIESVINEKGYSMQLASTRNDIENEGRALRTMLDNNVDGLIIEPTKSTLPNRNTDLYREISEKNIPLVFLNSYYPKLKFPYVALDDFKSGYVATKCLIDFGHKNIALALKSDDIQGHLRYSGAVAAANENNITISSENTFWYTTEDIKYLEADSKRILRYLKNCTGVFCYNDQLASIIIKILKEKGCKLPDDYSIIGIDDAKLSRNCHPRLTTVPHPKKELGIAITNLIFKLIDGENTGEDIIFEPKLIIRDSVKKYK